MKFRLRDRQVFFPIAEAKLGLDISRLPDDQTRQAAFRIRLDQDFTDILIDIAGSSARYAPQNRILGFRRPIFRLFIFCAVDNFYAATKFQEIGLAREQCQGGSPVRTIGYLCSARRSVGRNVKPHVRAIDDEEFLFGRFILPAHPPGLRKIDSARLSDAASITRGKLFVESRFECTSAAIAGFDSAANGRRVSSRGARNGNERESNAEKQAEHQWNSNRSSIRKGLRA